MAKSSAIQTHIVKFLSDGKMHNVQEIKAHLAEINVGEYSEGQFSGSLNTLQRNGTIKKTDRGIYSLRQKDEEDKNMKTCFVVSPIGDEGTETRKNADQLLKHIIEPVCKSCGFNVERVDKMNDFGSITEKIIERLENADLVIADISEHNPNVFYEIGYRARTKKPIIQLSKKGERIPFDIAAIRTYEYNLNDLDNVESVKDRLKNTIEAFSFEPVNADTTGAGDNAHEKLAGSIIPMLSQILDAISALHEEVKKNDSSAIIKTVMDKVIDSMQTAQPQMTMEERLMVQMMPTLIENPEALTQLMQFGKKFPSRPTNRK